MKDDNNFVNGVLLGGVIGVALGVMLAPNSGKETREIVVEKLHELKKYIATGRQAQDKPKSKLENSKEAKSSKKVVKKKVTNKKSKIKK